MSDLHVSIGGVAVTRARICIPNRGVWFADLDLADATLVAGRQTLKIGSSELSGAVDASASGTFGLARKLRLVGGAGGWGKLISARNYHADNGVRALTVAEDAATAAGETLAAGAAPADASVGIDYVRNAGPAARALEAACGGALWWIGLDGKTHIGARPETRPAPDTYEVLEHDPRNRLVTLAVDNVAAVMPGARLTERLDLPITVREVEIVIDSSSIRVTAWYGGDSTTDARLPAIMRAIVERVTDSRLHGVFRYRVIRMIADRCELQAVSRADGLPDILPISMWGAPGVHAKLSPGAEVLVAFVEGDRAQPVVIAFGPKGSSAFVPELITIADGDLPIARQGDLVQCGGTGTVVTFAPLNPTPGPMVPGTPYLISFSVTPPVPGLASPLYGSIAMGSGKARCG